jgi:hypothetical protein
MGLPAYRSSHEVARRLPEILSARGFSVIEEPIKANAVPAKPSFFYRVSDGRHAATVFGEYDSDSAFTMVIPRFSLRLGRSKFIASLHTSLLASGFTVFPDAKAA